MMRPLALVSAGSVIIGGAAGAGAGAGLSKEDNRGNGALIGLGTGAAIGLIVGALLDWNHREPSNGRFTKSSTTNADSYFTTAGPLEPDSQ